MSAVTRDKSRMPLPRTERADAVLSAVALLVCLLALILKASGVA